MPGSLSDILPQPLDEQSEEILNDLLKRKITSAAGLAVDLLHAMEERFGPEAREVVRDMAQRRQFRRTRRSRRSGGRPAPLLRRA